MAASGIFQWADVAGAAVSPPVQTSFPLPVLPSPRDVARALFAELGMDSFIFPAVTPREKLMRDIEIFAAGKSPENQPVKGAKPVAAPRAASGLFAAAPRVVAQATSAAAAMPLPVDHVAREERAVIGEADGASGLVSAPLLEGGSAPVADRAATVEEQGWLGLDMSQPREWSADDLAMLMFRDRVAAADSLSLRADQAAAGIHDNLDAFIDPYAFGDDASGEFAIDEHVFDDFAAGEFMLPGQIAA